MKVKVQIVIESDEATTETVENIIHIERGTLCSEDLGLTLAEARELLQNVQQIIVERQVSQYLARHASCPECGKKRRRRGAHSIVYRTLFGKLQLCSARLFHCMCQPFPTRSFSPLAQLLSERTAPELLYLEAKFASLISYGLTVDLLQEVLPIGQETNAATVRNNMHTVAKRIEDELGEERVMFIDGCERDWEQLPRGVEPIPAKSRSTEKLISISYVVSIRWQHHFPLIVNVDRFPELIQRRRHEKSLFLGNFVDKSLTRSVSGF